MLIVNVLPRDAPFLKTSVVIGSDPLNTLHVIAKISIPDDGIVMFCPHVKTAKDGRTNGGDDGGTRCGSPVYKGQSIKSK